MTVVTLHRNSTNYAVKKTVKKVCDPPTPFFGHASGIIDIFRPKVIETAYISLLGKLIINNTLQVAWLSITMYHASKL